MRRNRLVSATIAGLRTEAHRESDVNALKLELGPEDDALVDARVPPGARVDAAVYGSGYPVEGWKTV